MHEHFLPNLSLAIEDFCNNLSLAQKRDRDGDDLELSFFCFGQLIKSEDHLTVEWSEQDNEEKDKQTGTYIDRTDKKTDRHRESVVVK